MRRVAFILLHAGCDHHLTHAPHFIFANPAHEPVFPLAELHCIRPSPRRGSRKRFSALFHKMSTRELAISVHFIAHRGSMAACNIFAETLFLGIRRAQKKVPGPWQFTGAKEEFMTVLLFVSKIYATHRINIWCTRKGKKLCDVSHNFVHYASVVCRRGTWGCRTATCFILENSLLQRPFFTVIEPWCARLEDEWCTLVVV